MSRDGAGGTAGETGAALAARALARIIRRCIFAGMGAVAFFRGTQFVRMSNGDVCLVRPLGLVPGGKGMRHHETLLRLTPKGLAAGAGRAFGAVRARMRERLKQPAAVEVE